MDRFTRFYTAIAAAIAVIAVTVLLAACDGSVRVGPVEFGIEPTMTPIPTSTPVPTPTLTPTPSPTVETYLNDEYGFAFDYLSTWTLNQEPHVVRLKQGTLQLTIAYRWATETVALWTRTGVPAGDWIYGGKVSFLDQVIPAQILAYQNKDKAVFYGGTDLIQTADLTFVVTLEDLEGGNYEALDLSDLLQAEVKNILESFRRVEATGQPPSPSPTPPPVPTRTPTPAPGETVVAVVGWYGSVHSAPAGSGHDDYLVVLPTSSDGAGVAEVGLVGGSPSDEAAIAELRDKEPRPSQEGSKYAHFWGTLTCGVDDYGGCQLAVTHLRPDGPGPMFNPDPVEGWEGTIVTNSAWAQIDDAFVLAGEYPVQYGMWSEYPDLNARLEGYRNSGTPIRVWGQLLCGVPDANGCQIQAQRMEEVVGAEPSTGEAEWASYDNKEFGFSFQYPATWTLEEVPGRLLPEEPGRPAGKCSNTIVLSQGTLAIQIQYLRGSDGLYWCGVGTVANILEPTHQEQVTVMGQPARRNAQEHEDAVKAVDVYVDDVADLFFTFMLRDTSDPAYTAPEMKALPESAVTDLDRILSSFERVQ